MATPNYFFSSRECCYSSLAKHYFSRLSFSKWPFYFGSLFIKLVPFLSWLLGHFPSPLERPLLFFSSCVISLIPHLISCIVSCQLAPSLFRRLLLSLFEARSQFFYWVPSSCAFISFFLLWMSLVHQHSYLQTCFNFSNTPLD